MSYQEVKAAAMDAANRRMKANRRDAWNVDDYNLACRTLARLWPSCETVDEVELPDTLEI